MAVASADIKQYKSASHPTDDVTASGGAITATEITGASIGEIFPRMDIDPVVSTTWYYKIFVKNTHATDTFYYARFYMANALIQPVASGVVALTPDISETGNYARIVGYSGGAWTYEDVTFSGTSTVYSINSFDYVRRVELRVTATDLLTDCSDDITIVRGITLGKIFYDDINSRGCNGAWGESAMALELTVDGAGNVANRLTCPDDGLATPTPLSFTVPNTLATALTCVAGDTNLDAAEAQGIWLRWVTPGGIYGGEDIPLFVVAYGGATS